jgi:hypothetical protein
MREFNSASDGDKENRSFDHPHLPKISPENIETIAPQVMHMDQVPIDVAYKYLEGDERDSESLATVLRTSFAMLHVPYDTNPDVFQDIKTTFRRGAVCAAVLLEEQSFHDKRDFTYFPSAESKEIMSGGFLAKTLAARPEPLDFTGVAIEKLRDSGVGEATITFLSHLDEAARTGACTVFMAYAFEAKD